MVLHTQFLGMKRLHLEDLRFISYFIYHISNALISIFNTHTLIYNNTLENHVYKYIYKFIAHTYYSQKRCDVADDCIRVYEIMKIIS